MKIALVLNTSWNVINFRMGLMKALMNQGHEICVVAPRDEYTAQIQALGCDFQHVYMDSRGVNPAKDLALIIELTTLYKRISPDVVLHFTIKPNIYGSLAAALAGVPSINNVSGLGTVFLKKNYVTRIARFLYKLSFRYPEKVFFQNNDDLELFVNTGLVEEGKTALVPGSGINTAWFKAAPFQRNNPFTFLVISRLIYDKGIQEYIDAITLLQDENIAARFQLLGARDPEHKRGIPNKLINQWIDQQKVEYLGTTDDVRNFIQQADCIVLPSYREGTPRTLLEAASSARPIITTNVPGCRHVVENGRNGLLCNVKSAKDLADKMKRIIQMEDTELIAMGKEGRKKVIREFDEKLVISQYIEAINLTRNTK